MASLNKDPKANGEGGQELFASIASKLTDEMLLDVYKAHVAVIWKIAAAYLNKRYGKRGHFSIVKDEESKAVDVENFKLRCAFIHDKHCDRPITVARFAFVPLDGYYEIFAMIKNRSGRYVRASKPIISTQDIDSLRPDMLSTLPTLHTHLNRKVEPFFESHHPKEQAKPLKSEQSTLE